MPKWQTHHWHATTTTAIFYFSNPGKIMVLLVLPLVVALPLVLLKTEFVKQSVKKFSILNTFYFVDEKTRKKQ